jgi:hypothetical protein
MNELKDTVYVFLGLVAALAALVVVAVVTKGAGADTETQQALSYAVVGLVGALGGVARKS